MTIEEYRSFKRNNSATNVVATNGCFDVLHIGHIRFLKEAAKLGSTLIVGLNSDESVRKLKGENRPIFTQEERQEVLLALSVVYAVVIFDEITATNFLSAVEPDVWVKGGDWTLETLNPDERKAVEQNGGKIEIIPMLSPWSSTSCAVV